LKPGTLANWNPASAFALCCDDDGACVERAADPLNGRRIDPEPGSNLPVDLLDIVGDREHMSAIANDFTAVPGILAQSSTQLILAIRG
jgi:hypothetical protein